MSNDANTPELKIVETPKKLILHPERWNYKDFMKFSQLSQVDTIQAFRKAQEIIAEWGYEIPLSEENALAKLPLGEGAKVIRTILSTLSTAMENVSIADVSVDFSRANWSTLDMQRFLEALKAFDYETVETMVHQVAKVEGLKAGETLPMGDGSAMVKAIQKRYTDLMSGKF